MDVSLNLKVNLFWTASLLQCFVSQLRTSSARKLGILENSECIKSKTQLALGKNRNVPVPHSVGAGSLQAQGEQVQGAGLGRAQLKSGPSKPGKVEQSLCASLGWNGEIVSNSAGGVCRMEKGIYLSAESGRSCCVGHDGEELLLFPFHSCRMGDAGAPSG